MYYERLDKIILKGENKFGRWLWTAMVSVFLMLAAALYVRPALHTVEMGTKFAQLSKNPFATNVENIIGFRILTPLISYLIGLRGELIIVTNLIFAALLIGLVYQYFRHHSPHSGDSFIAAAAITFSLVTLTTIYYGGYCDSSTYLIIFLMWWQRSRRIVFYILFLLGLLNHESVGFLTPWLAYISLKEFPSKRRGIFDLIIGFGLAFGIYFLYRKWISSRIEIFLSISFYLKPLLKDPLHHLRYSHPYHFLGFFTVFKALWIFPIIAIISLWLKGKRDQVFSIVLLICCAWLQMVVAFDSSRMLTLCFMVMIISLTHLFNVNPLRFRVWAGLAILINFFVPQLFTAAKIVEVMQSTILGIIKL